MSALVGGIEFTFFLILFLLEFLKTPSERVWAKVQLCAKKPADDDEDAEGADVEAGGAADAVVEEESDAEYDDEEIPLLGGGGGAAAGGDDARIAALEAMSRRMDDMFRRTKEKVRDLEVLHAKVRGNSAAVSTLFNGGKQVPKKLDKMEALFLLEKITVICIITNVINAELARLVNGVFQLATQHSHARRPTWHRVVGGETVALYSRHGYWWFGVSLYSLLSILLCCTSCHQQLHLIVTRVSYVQRRNTMCLSPGSRRACSRPEQAQEPQRNTIRSGVASPQPQRH